MPVLSTDIWRLKRYVAETITQAINQEVRFGSMTVDSIVDKGAW